MATQLGDFSGFAQRVWKEPTIGGKTMIIHEMINACRSNEQKKATFRHNVGKMNSLQRLDKFAADMMLVDTDKRIK